MLCLKSLKKEERQQQRGRFDKNFNRGTDLVRGCASDWAVSVNVLNANETGDVYELTARIYLLK